jgi:hypothetical protein
MTMFLNELISEYHRAITLLQRRATGDYSPDSQAVDAAQPAPLTARDDYL